MSYIRQAPPSGRTSPSDNEPVLACRIARLRSIFQVKKNSSSVYSAFHNQRQESRMSYAHSAEPRNRILKQNQSKRKREQKRKNAEENENKKRRETILHMPTASLRKRSNVREEQLTSHARAGPQARHAACSYTSSHAQLANSSNNHSEVRGVFEVILLLG